MHTVYTKIIKPQFKIFILYRNLKRPSRYKVLRIKLRNNNNKDYLYCYFPNFILNTLYLEGLNSSWNTH